MTNINLSNESNRVENISYKYPLPFVVMSKHTIDWPLYVIACRHIQSMHLVSLFFVAHDRNLWSKSINNLLANHIVDWDHNVRGWYSQNTIDLLLQCWSDDWGRIWNGDRTSFHSTNRVHGKKPANRLLLLLCSLLAHGCTRESGSIEKQSMV